MRNIVILLSVLFLFHCSKQSNEFRSIELVRVEGGTYLMGGPEGVADIDTSPQHWVTVKSFEIGKFEVTQAQWIAIVQWKRKHGGTILREIPGYDDGDEYPINNISWDDVKLWIDALNQMKGKHYRLPTESEWEYAARGGIFWNDEYIYSGGNCLDEVGWYTRNSVKDGEWLEKQPVGLKKPNQLGIYDMSGNVWEWCEDAYLSYRDNIHNKIKVDTTIQYRICRGGSNYQTTDRDCRVFVRGKQKRSSFGGKIGFRIAQDVEEAK